MKQDKHSKHAMTEVELDAVDLVGLTPAHTDKAALSAPQTEPYAPLQASFDEEIAALGMPMPNEGMECVLPQPKRRLLGNRALGVFGLVLITSAAVVAHQVATSKPPSERVTTIAWTPLPERADIAVAEAEEEAAPQPTLFANPFDPSEVFELEPGLTEEEARQQVAQILLERARERMASR